MLTSGFTSAAAMTDSTEEVGSQSWLVVILCLFTKTIYLRRKRFMQYFRCRLGSPCFSLNLVFTSSDANERFMLLFKHTQETRMIW